MAVICDSNWLGLVIFDLKHIKSKKKHKNMHLKRQVCACWEFVMDTSFAKSFTGIWLPNYKWHTVTYNLLSSHIHILPWSHRPRDKVHIQHSRSSPYLFAIHFQVSPHIHNWVPVGYFSFSGILYKYVYSFSARNNYSEVTLCWFVS